MSVAILALGGANRQPPSRVGNRRTPLTRRPADAWSCSAKTSSTSSAACASTASSASSCIHIRQQVRPLRPRPPLHLRPLHRSSLPLRQEQQAGHVAGAALPACSGVPPPEPRGRNSVPSYPLGQSARAAGDPPGESHGEASHRQVHRPVRYLFVRRRVIIGSPMRTARRSTWDAGRRCDVPNRDATPDGQGCDSCASTGAKQKTLTASA